MIRSHNEVMQVIGVAEPENTNIFAEAEMQREHHEYEQRMGYHLLDIARVVQICGISVGMNGFRQRILVCETLSPFPPKPSSLLTTM